MSQTNQIGLDAAKATQLTDKLNVLLADYQIFYINARGFHWNIKGDKFFELHAKFEEIYTDALVKIDEIAERILTLGNTPIHSFSEYVNTSSIEEITNVSEGKAALQHVLTGLQTVIGVERELLDLSAEINDQGTNSLMSDYLGEQEKLVWMFSAFLK